MKIKNIIITLATILTTTSLASAEPWTNPTTSAPSDNAPSPINTSSYNQAKEGGLSLGNLSVTGSAAFGVFTGNVGIGTASPKNTLKLDVRGKVGALKYCNLSDTKCFTADESVTTTNISEILNTTNITNNASSTTNILTTENFEEYLSTSTINITNNNNSNIVTTNNITNIVNNLGLGNWTKIGTNLYYNNTGNVGIGTNSPSNKLEVAGNIEANRYCDRNAANCLTPSTVITNSNIATTITNLGLNNWTKTGTNLYYNTGNVGIGTASPSNKLEVAGNIEANRYCDRNGNYCFYPYQVSSASTGDNLGNHSATSHLRMNGKRIYLDSYRYIESRHDSINFSHGLVINGANFEGASISTSRRIGTTSINLWGTTSSQLTQGYSLVATRGIKVQSVTQYSDIRKKQAVKTSKGLDIINKLRGVSFEWKDTKQKDYGVIAQEVEKVMPEIVNTGEDGMKSVKYSSIIAPLVEAVKEQQKEIENQQKQINELKKQNKLILEKFKKLNE